MKKLSKIEYLEFCFDSLCIYKLDDDPVLSSLGGLVGHIFLAEDEEDTDYYMEAVTAAADVFGELAKRGSLKSWVSKAVLENDNIFTRACAAGKAGELSGEVINAVKEDLKKLEAISNVSLADICSEISDDKFRTLLSEMPGWEVGSPCEPLKSDWPSQTAKLEKWHLKNGYGIYASFYAFQWHDGELVPVKHPDDITLNDLKNYERQRQTVIENTENFLRGLPANNVLLYGDRGTGKSSTVHAILNKYHENGLRMIEISKDDIPDLFEIREKIADSPMKFIIFIDDLYFDAHDDSFGKLKASLEGSLSAKGGNILIYATSNRRHLIREKFSDRNNDVNRNDIMQEQLSLSDRFGIYVTFINPSKREYLDIVDKIASDRGLEYDAEKLHLEAEQWATRRGGRSPRCARQFVDYLEGKIKGGRQIF